MIYALGHLSPLVIGIGLLIQPVFAAALGWSIFDEKLATADIIGAVLVAIALVLVRSSEVASAPKEPKSA
jgi:drug/metabolite transporter (DMT)-like permease